MLDYRGKHGSTEWTFCSSKGLVSSEINDLDQKLNRYSFQIIPFLKHYIIEHSVRRVKDVLL